MKYDVIVIGSGPGGYVSAIRCSQLGLKTAIIERYKTLGGTCLNVGCIPSKALLDSSEHYYNAAHHFEDHGIATGKLKLDLKKMIARKASVVDQNVKGIDYLMKKNKIDVHHGHGTISSKHEVAVTSDSGEKSTLATDKIIIATGSKPSTPAAFNYDKERVISSTEALNIEVLPKRMVIIGGGVIGLEMGSVFGRLGTEVEIVEYMDRILPGMDKDCARDLQKTLKRMGIKFHTKHKVVDVVSTGKAVTVKVQKRDSEETFELKADYCLISIGRRPYTDNLGLENVGINVDDRGRVEVNDHLQTSVENIYAIGDVIKGAMLAHKAEDEGVFVAESIAGEKPHIDYNLIPGVVYTWPEMASVGITEEQAKERNLAVKVGKFPFKALGRARASMDLDGLVKIIADETTDEVLGVHIVGARAADLIMEAVALMEFRATAEDISRICHPHPTYSEAIKEAALAATGNRPIHM